MKENLIRKDVGSFSIVVLREALVNAFAHRDYKIDGNEVCIDCYPDRVEISSPGAMLQSGYDRKVQKLESVVSQRRNHTICDIFVLCKLMEKKGSGFDRIIEDYKNLSDDYFPLCITTRTSFTIVLKNKKYNLNKIKIKEKEISLNEDNVLLKTRDEILNKSESMRNVYILIKNNPQVTYEILSKETGLSREGVKYNIKKLKDALLISKNNIRDEFRIIDDIKRPCSINALDVEIKNKILSWININLGKNVDVENAYKKFVIESAIYITKEQFLGALILSNYLYIDKTMKTFVKN